MADTLSNQKQIKEDFVRMLAQRHALKQTLKTQEEIAKREQDRNLVHIAAQYTPNLIVKGLADLQLMLADASNDFKDKLLAELSKLNDIKASIKVAQEQLKEVEDLQLAAEALHILQQEQSTQKQDLIQLFEQKTKILEDEITQTKLQWAKEQQQFELNQQEYTQNLAEERAKEQADYTYQLERTYKLEADDYAEKTKLLERELLETEANKHNDWAIREKFLADNQSKFEEYKSKVDASESEIQAAVAKAKEMAIQETTKDAKINAELLEKEIIGQKTIYELQISGNEEILANQAAQIEKLQTSLKDALAQLQNFSLKTIENSKN